MNPKILESSVQRSVWLALSDQSTLFRVNTGKAWVGSGKVVRMPDGSALVPGARSISLGLTLTNSDPVVGTADLLGWTTITVTPEMVGRKLAVFTATETKASRDGRVSDDQKRFLNNVREAGGFALVANSDASALQNLAMAMDGDFSRLPSAI